MSQSAARQLIVIRVKFSLWILHRHTMNLTKKARQRLIKFEFHENEILQAIHQGVRFALRRRNIPRRRFAHESIGKRHENVGIIYFTDVDARYVVIDVFPAKYRCDIQDFWRVHDNNRALKRRIFQTLTNIPQTIEVVPPVTMQDGPGVEVFTCRQEIFEVINDNDCRYTMTPHTPQSTDLNEYHLSRQSAFRMAEDFMREPLGLLHESHVLRLCNLHGIMCPTCGQRLALGGGSGTAWADLVCTSCPTYIEIKTKDRLRERLNVLRGGSYRWFQAQKNAGIQHYVIVVLRTGGTVNMYRISNCEERVDDKFLAYYNDGDRVNVEPSLRSWMKLEDRVELFDIDHSREREERYRAIANEQMNYVFGNYATMIQRRWRRR